MPKVAIIGGGLAGLLLALYLHKYSIPCAIYEGKHKGFAAGGNIALSPNALRALDHAGVYEILRTQGFAFDEVKFLNGRGKQLAMVLNGSYDIYHFPALRISRTVLRDTLLKELEKIGTEIHFDKKCVGIKEETADRVLVEFADGDVIEAEHVVGADGIHSKIRPYVRPGDEPEFQDLAGISGTYNLSDMPDVPNTVPLPSFLFGANGSFAVMPSSADGDSVSYFATFEVPERSREEWAEFDADKKLMGQMLRQRFHPGTSWPPVVKALCERAKDENLTLWPFYQVAAGTHWTSKHKRIMLVGDAAHAMPPSGGQGGATSFEDAETLGYTLAHVYASDFQQASRPEAITAWEKHRIERITRIQHVNNRNGNLRKTSPSWLHQWVKEWKIWIGLNIIMGPKMGVDWVYSYDGESVRADLGTIGRPKPGVSLKSG